MHYLYKLFDPPVSSVEKKLSEQIVGSRLFLFHGNTESRSQTCLHVLDVEA